ncbi:hypothetical protein [Pseudomonas pohangensis]|uniref:hypothetical protein n=1 Tax=Pseudomonas pohangensis TaxID=364197 RepID=UPI000B7DA169|nr:hypothetical protein [Pseudomonas pohangensis]
MGDVNLPQLLIPVVEVVLSAGKLIEAEWMHAGDPRGQRDKADFDVENERTLRQRLLALLPSHFLGEEIGHGLTVAKGMKSIFRAVNTTIKCSKKSPLDEGYW